MNTDPKNNPDSFADQLSNFDVELLRCDDDVSALATLEEDVRKFLINSGDSEIEIRRKLKQVFESGDMRQQTFRLVSALLDGFVSESVATAPTDWGTSDNRMTLPNNPVSEPVSEPLDDFAATTVIPVTVEAGQSRATTSRLQVGSVLRDRFVLQQKVAGGSMGMVYKALDRRLAESGSDEQWVAIKVLSTALAENAVALRALQQEAAKGRCLVHPNIVRFIDLDRDGDQFFIVMEWMEGRTLAEILDSRDRLNLDRDTAIRMFRQIGEALDYAHRCGIVHADIKPGNVMVLSDGSAKLFDFGVARVQQQRVDRSFDPGVLGALTPAYSSMQVLTGEEPVAADDVFSLACLVYRLVAGYRVFGPRNAAEAAEEGMEPQRPQGFNDGQWRTVKKALSYPRITRYETVREFLDAFEGAKDDVIRVDVPDRFDGGEPESSGFKAWALVLLLLLLGTAGFGYWGGYYDRWLPQEWRLASTPVIVSAEVPSPAETDPEIEVAISDADDRFSETANSVDEDSSDETDTTLAPELSAPVAGVPTEPAVGPLSNTVDFSTLPPATLEVPIERRYGTQEAVDINVREDGAPVIVDFVRTADLGRALQLRLDEVGFSGNRSPWASGQFAYSNGGIVNLPAGQARGRIVLTMASDPLREADQVSTLRLRDVDSTDAAYALLSVTLQDDDQRRFEAQLEPNTIAFAASQAFIRETDPAVQIDLVRFNPDDTTVTATFTVTDITATEGEDYFAPNASSVRFGPGQRSARLLIPLVQDNLVEGDEAFIMQLIGPSATAESGVYQRIAVIIRDDEPQTR